MVSVAYGTFIDDIKDKLVALVRTATSFADATHIDYVKRSETNPIARISLRRDTMTAVGFQVTSHVLTFRIWMQYLGGYGEKTLDEVVGYVGEIVDVIEGSRTMGSTYVRNTEVSIIDFSFREDQSAVLHNADITVMVYAERNA